MKTIMQTQSNFKIYYEGEPARVTNALLKVEHVMYVKVIPFLNKVNDGFATHRWGDN